MIARCLLSAAVMLLCPVAACQNLVVNPSAEDVNAEGKPVGWSRYVGAGKCELTSCEEAPHSGRRCVRLKMTEWYVPKEEGKKPVRSSNCGVIIGDSDGYRGADAFPADGGRTYAFTLWAKGDVPRLRVSVTAWTSDTADLESRVSVPTTLSRFMPSNEWRRVSGRFRLPDDARKFVLGIYASGKEKDGWKLGTIYLDDASIRPLATLDRELRAVWWGRVRAKTEEEGMKEIRDSISQLKSAGFNAIFASENTLYMAAIKDKKYLDDVPSAGWDAFGKVVAEAKAAGMQVHLWFSPWIYKRKSSAVELREHPEWAAVQLDGTPSGVGVCAARPEVREFELQTVMEFIERYPQLDGIHLEEPGYAWGDYCFCDYCREIGRRLFGFDFKERPNDPAISHFKALVCNDFVLRLRREMLDRAPHMLLSYNGSAGANPDWYIGRDWLRLARFSAIDFYVPQVYTTSTEKFTRRLRETIEADQPAKREFFGRLRTKYGSIEAFNKAWNMTCKSWEILLAEPLKLSADKLTDAARTDCSEFLTHFARRYFRTVRETVNRHAPRQLYLGCRFSVRPVEVVKVAVEFCDVVSFNIYRPRLKEADWSFTDTLGKPVIIGEFGFGSTDRGMFHYGAIPARDQAGRGRAYQEYVRSVLQRPAFVGCHWFQYVDKPLVGRFDGENYNVGFVAETDTPHRELRDAAREINSKIYVLRGGRKDRP